MEISEKIKNLLTPYEGTYKKKCRGRDSNPHRG